MGDQVQNEKAMSERRAVERARLHAKLDKILDKRVALETSITASGLSP